MLNVVRLKELLSYNPDTGLFTRLKGIRGKGTKAGTIAGSIARNGYVNITLDKKRYRAHRLVWLYMTGEWPKNQIDHINMNRSDNRFCNLREASNNENMRNKRVQSNNKSTGEKNITIIHPYHYKHLSYFKVQICANGKTHGKQFKTLNEAIDYRDKMLQILHGNFARSA